MSAHPSPTPTVTARAVSRIDEEALDAELVRSESRFEKYGGDDPEEPAPKEHGRHVSRSLSVASSMRKEKLPTAPTLASAPSQLPDPNLVTWDGPNDPENPQTWSFAYKWTITMVCSLATINVTFASSAPSSASHFIAEDLHSSTEVSYLVTSIFLLGYVFGPMFWGPGSEIVGRRPIFVFTLLMYTIFHIGQGQAQNMATLLVTRFFSGFFACAPLTNGGGLIADIWDPVNRGIATAIFGMTVFLGPVLGPVAGSFIAVSYLGWRWIFWVMMMFAGACTLVVILFLPETYAPKILLEKAKRLRKQDPVGNKDIYAESERVEWTLKVLLERTILRPFKMLLVEPILLLVTIYLSVVYGVLYALFEAFPVIFIKTRGLTVSQDGLIFLGTGIGTVLATMIYLWLLRPYPRLMKEWRGFPPAENRLYGAMVAGPLLVIGTFWLGWTGNYESVPWYVPALATIPIGMSISLVFISFLSYLVDTYLMYSASALAANTIVRSAVGVAFPLFTVQMFEGLGINWAATLIGGVCILLAPIPFLFHKYGARIRSNSKFAPCLDLKIAKVIAEEKAEAEKGEV